MTPEQVRAAFEDLLTGLPTRYVMYERLRAAKQAGVPAMAAMVDLDHFKYINDRFGHFIGDELLRLVAQRLQEDLPPGGWVARMGGDEFWIMLPGLSQDQAVGWLEDARHRLQAPMDILPDLHTTVSIGVAAFTLQSLDTLVNACDLAVYAAKARGRNQIVVFDDDTRAIAAARHELAATVAELQRRNKALYAEARADALTGLANRRALDETLAALPAGQGGAVAFVDVDHFGRYNKHHGDHAGDAALRALAQAIKGTLRDDDLAFRKGGEELVVLLEGVDPPAALRAAERLRQAVLALALPHGDSPTAAVLTVTIGVAVRTAERDWEGALAAAGQLAMDGKNAGQRNQVHGALPLRAARGAAA